MRGCNNVFTIGHSSLTCLFLITKDGYLLVAYRSALLRGQGLLFFGNFGAEGDKCIKPPEISLIFID